MLQKSKSLQYFGWKRWLCLRGCIGSLLVIQSAKNEPTMKNSPSESTEFKSESTLHCVVLSVCAHYAHQLENHANAMATRRLVTSQMVLLFQAARSACKVASCLQLQLAWPSSGLYLQAPFFARFTLEFESLWKLSALWSACSV